MDRKPQSREDRLRAVTGRLDVSPPDGWFDTPGVLRPVAPRHDAPFAKPTSFPGRTPR